MDEQIAAFGVRQLQAAHEGDMRRRNCLGEPPPRGFEIRSAHAVARQRVEPAIGAPMRPNLGAFEELKKVVLVITHEVDVFKSGERLIQQQVDHTARVRTAIDIIAEIDDDSAARSSLGGVRGDEHMQPRQQIEPPVHVADGVNPRSRWYGGRHAGAAPAVIPAHRLNIMA